MQTYLFYDIETSGLNKCFDQVVQFAAIRTDLELKELERHELLVKLNPDTVPSPYAILTHKFGVDQLQQGIPEYEAIVQIHQLLNAPGTISVGYNTLGFDDEFLRFSFYRNLLPPYTHQYANSCGRMDLYPLAILYYLFKPNVICWPKINEIVTFKLEHLSSHNELAVGNAHEAMTDVRAVLELARCLRKEREMWDYACGYFNKASDSERVRKLATVLDGLPQALLIEGGYAAAKSYQVPTLGLGMHNHYTNQSLWLQLDAPDFAKITAENIASKTYIARKRFGEPPLCVPMQGRFLQHLAVARQEMVELNLKFLQKNPQFLADVEDYHKEYKYPEVPNLDVDAALYQNGFLKDYEQAWCSRFHAATLADKLPLIDKVTNSNLRTQAIRILGRNYPEKLTAELQQEFNSYLKRVAALNEDAVLVDYRNTKRLTPKKAMAEIVKIRATKELSSIERGLLDGVEKWLNNF